MRYHQIVEAPQKIVIPQVAYDNRAYNRRFAAKQKNKIKEIIEQTNGYILARTGDGFNGWLIAFTPDYMEALYVVRYLAKRWSWLPTTVTQIELWRSTGSPQVLGITQHVFFDVLLPRYKTILSDRQQSEFGQRFWIDRMADAAHRGMRVGIAHMITKTVHWYDPAADGVFRDWLSGQDTFGTPQWYQAVRYIISVS